MSAEEAYAAITVPVFGKDVVYDVPYPVLVEQKKYALFLPEFRLLMVAGP